MIRRRIVVITVASVLACGGDSGTAPTTPPTPNRPQITAQPQSVTVDQGAAATFSVTATGEALTYQWKRDGGAIGGATGASYTLASPAATDHGASFSVAVTNAGGTVESSSATLSVRTPPAITGQPQSRTALSGVSALFSVTATGTAPTYQWYRNGTAIPGATAAKYAVGVPLAGDDGARIHVVVSNMLGTVTSAEAVLSVNSGGPLRPTSYANAKAMNSAAVVQSDWWTARAVGDFFGNGNRDLFLSTGKYDWNRPQSEAIPGKSQFMRWTPSGYVADDAIVADTIGCIHSRKAVVADFNGDQKPDIFIACHGYDRAPFPGEPNYLLLSQAAGGYARRSVANGMVGFFHTATAGDVNGDGHMDVIVTDNFQQPAVFVLAGDGQGNFTKRTDLINIGGGAYFTAELADVNGDGLVDLLVGGHDWEDGPTRVYVNNGTTAFAGVTPSVLPVVPNEGVVLDFTVLDADRNGVNEIYILRTSGGDGTFYESLVVQRVSWPDLTGTVLYNVRGQRWLDFAFPYFANGRYSLISNTTEVPFSLPLN